MRSDDFFLLDYYFLCVARFAIVEADKINALREIVGGESRKIFALRILNSPLFNRFAEGIHQRQSISRFVFGNEFDVYKIVGWIRINCHGFNAN